jgi:hypothetical protein
MHASVCRLVLYYVDAIVLVLSCVRAFVAWLLC